MRTRQTTLLTAASLALVSLSSLAHADPVTPARLANAGAPAEAGNWLMANQTYGSFRNSTLNEITPANVGHLRLAFAVPLDRVGRAQGGAIGTPLINDGFIYITDQFGTPNKINGATGQIVWYCDTGVNTEPGAMTRTRNIGLALFEDSVVTALGDGRVVSCDAQSGEVVWDSQISHDPGESFEGNIMAFNDKLVVGQAAGDWATRGYMSAIDPADGQEIWRFYTIPGPGEPGHETWKCELTANPNCWNPGGGALWSVGSYDPDLNLIYWGTGNPSPMMDPEYRPGDNLYTMSTLAINQSDGTLKWYFQHIPNDMTDYDSIGLHLLADVTIDGQPRKIAAMFHRNGFLYRLDRATGAFIDANAYIKKLNWTAGIDAKTGLPVEYNPNVDLQVYAFGAQRRGGPDVEPCPHQHGAINFQQTAYNPATGVAYGMTMDYGCYTQNAGAGFTAAAAPGAAFMVGEGGHMRQLGDAPTAALIAYDLNTAKEVGRREISTAAGNGGTALSTGIVWSALNDGTFGAWDAATLEPLWSTNTGMGHRGAPSVYAVDGKQYVTILAAPASAHGYPAVSAKPPAVILYTFTL